MVLIGLLKEGRLWWYMDTAGGEAMVVLEVLQVVRLRWC